MKITVEFDESGEVEVTYRGPVPSLPDSALLDQIMPGLSEHLSGLLFGVMSEEEPEPDA